MKHTRLIVVLLFAVMFLLLIFLVSNVTSCAPITPNSVQAAQPTPTTIPSDGSIYHPWFVDADPYGNVDTWDVLTVNGHEKWTLTSFLWTIKPGQYILYRNAEYQVSAINRKALTMAAIILGN